MAVSKKVEETPIIPEDTVELPRELIRVFQQYGIRLNNALLRDGSEEMEGDLVLVNQDPTQDRHAAYKKYVDDQIAAIPAGIPSGTRVFFDQDTAPTGWTRDTTINDRVIRIVSGARAHGGSWTISGISLPSHTHPMPHTHQITHPSMSPAIWSGGALAVGAYGVNTSGPSSAANTGNRSNSAVDHDGTWRPLHRDVIVASKD